MKLSGNTLKAKNAALNEIMRSAKPMVKVKDTLTEFSPDASALIEKGATKYDGGKPAVYQGAIGYFPRAIREVSAVSTFGASKYAWKGWEQVPDGFNRYSDALGRHLLQEASGEDIDGDSGLLHAAQVAWNALARLELKLRENELQRSD
jgi:hypothetical protein